MLRKIKSLSIAFTALLMVTALPAQALTLGFNPSDQNVGLGDKVFVDVVASNVGGLLTTYDFDVTYDASILSFAGIYFAGALDGINPFYPFGPQPSYKTSNFGTPGILSVFEFGLLPGFQPLSFPLFTLKFDAIDYGTSALNISTALITQGAIVNGNSANIDIEPGSVKVPEPTSLLLLGMAAMFASRRKMAAQL